MTTNDPKDDQLELKRDKFIKALDHHHAIFIAMINENFWLGEFKFLSLVVIADMIVLLALYIKTGIFSTFTLAIIILFFVLSIFCIIKATILRNNIIKMIENYEQSKISE
jgi:hypothetical protein